MRRLTTLVFRWHLKTMARIGFTLIRLFCFFFTSSNKHACTINRSTFVNTRYWYTDIKTVKGCSIVVREAVSDHQGTHVHFSIHLGLPVNSCVVLYRCYICSKTWIIKAERTVLVIYAHISILQRTNEKFQLLTACFNSNSLRGMYICIDYCVCVCETDIWAPVCFR